MYKYTLLAIAITTNIPTTPPFFPTLVTPPQQQQQQQHGFKKNVC